MVSRSSTEAEYHTLSLAIAEIFWLRMLLKELQISLSSPLTLRCDNSGVLSLATNQHIEVDVHFVP